MLNKTKYIILALIMLILGGLIFWFVWSQNTGQKYSLPAVLHEISGIAYLGNNKIAAVQDEAGVVYIYDLESQAIVEEIPFSGPGDYEDIAVANGYYYILRSDGTLFETNQQGTREYVLGSGANNNEGLAYDSRANRLLVATKSKVDKGKEFKNLRYIYEFNLQTKQLSAEPVLIINIEDIQKFVPKESKKTVKFRPSAMAFHPQTHNLHIISAIDNILIVISPDSGQIKNVQQLDLETFNQPEGLAFLENGQALVANEGGSGRPTLLKLE